MRQAARGVVLGCGSSVVVRVGVAPLDLKRLRRRLFMVDRHFALMTVGDITHENSGVYNSVAYAPIGHKLELFLFSI
jgi:hypothetical protein